jgi:trk system potassium uptake protein TrkA
MKIIIVGGSETGVRLANLLAEQEDVTIIESDEEVAKSIANQTSALIIKGDGTDRSVLKDAGIDIADVVIPLTGDDKTNLMISVIAKSEKTNKIVPIVNSTENESLFPKIGINSYISLVGAKVSAVKDLIYVYGDARVIGQTGGGEVQIIEVSITSDSKLIDKKADIRRGVFQAIFREGKIILPDDNTKLQEGDTLLLLVKTKELNAVIESVTGK